MNNEELKYHYDSLLKNEDFDKLDLGLKNPKIFQILQVAKDEIRHSNFLSWSIEHSHSFNLDDISLMQYIGAVLSTNTTKLAKL